MMYLSKSCPEAGMGGAMVILPPMVGWGHRVLLKLDGVGSISKHKSNGLAPGEHSTTFACSVVKVTVGEM